MAYKDADDFPSDLYVLPMFTIAHNVEAGSAARAKDRGNAIVDAMWPTHQAAAGLFVAIDLAPATLIDVDEAALFPLNAVIAVRMREADVALVGREGALTAPMWGESAIVRIAGRALAIESRRFERLKRSSPTVIEALHGFADSLSRQVAATVASDRLDAADRRVARWLLMLHDRVGETIPLTHERLAAVVGVRRATITDQIHVLEGEHVVKSTRGSIQVIDRLALERRAGPAYRRKRD